MRSPLTRAGAVSAMYEGAACIAKPADRELQISCTSFGTAPANAIVKGTLEYMVCDDAQCLPPETVEFSISVK